MRLLSQHEIIGMEFSDAKILEFEFSASRLEFLADFCIVEGEGVIDEETRVLVEGWDSVVIQRYDGEQESSVDIDAAKSLRETCERSISLNSFKVAGFETDSGLWESFDFKQPKVRVTLGSEGE